jgi:hypothetical protein
LAKDFEVLSSAFGEELEKRSPPKTSEAKRIAWYRRLAQEVFQRVAEQDDMPLWWCESKEYKFRKIRPPKTAPVARPAPLTHTDTSSPADPLEGIYDRPITEYPVITWKQLNLDHALRQMVNGKMGKAGEGGNSAYLARSVLAALLNTTPLKIRNAIDNFDYPRRSK